MKNLQSTLYFSDFSFFKALKTSMSSVNKPVIKTWSRSSLITSNFLGLKLKIYNGKDFIPLTISEDMIGHKLGEFAATRAKFEFKKKKRKKK